MKTLDITDSTNRGRIQFVKLKKNSKLIKVSVDVDNYGFIVGIPKEDLEELLK